MEVLVMFYGSLMNGLALIWPNQAHRSWHSNMYKAPKLLLEIST